MDCVKCAFANSEVTDKAAVTKGHIFTAFIPYVCSDDLLSQSLFLVTFILRFCGASCFLAPTCIRKATSDTALELKQS